MQLNLLSLDDTDADNDNDDGDVGVCVEKLIIKLLLVGVYVTNPQKGYFDFVLNSIYTRSPYCYMEMMMH
jgi:hypothetical protein